MLPGRTAFPSDARSVLSPRFANVERWFTVIAFVLMGVSVWFTGSEGDADVMQGSPLAQLLWGVVYLAAVVGVWRNRDKLPQLMRLSLPIVAIVALAVISSAWSTDPGITLKRAFGLFGTTAFGYYVVSRFKLRDFVDIFGLTCCVVIALSLLAVFFAPSIGVMQNDYAGAWRGIFDHKNFFGEFMAVAIVTFATIALSNAWRRGIALAGLLLAVFCIIQSQSVTAWLVTLVMASAVGLAVLYRRGARSRAAAVTIAVAAPLAALLIFSSGDVSQAVLGLLGRDNSLTGRADFWPEVVQAISFRPLLGYGYGAFWLPNGSFSYFIHSGFVPAHAHNGYLEACLDIGVLGSVIGAIAILIAMRRGAVLLARAVNLGAMWPFLVTVYFVVVNVTESSIATYNNFNWVMFVIAFLYASQSARLE
jgi:exopolysaccharide production protein ExoQ